MGVQDLRSGDDRWIDITAVPLFRDGDERPHQVCSLFDEITERKRAKTSCDLSERQFRSIFLASQDTIVIADDEGRYTDANPAAGELFQCLRDQLVGRHGEEFIDPSIDFPTAWAEFRRTGGSHGIFRLIRLDGTVREVEHSSTLNFLPGRHMAILHDVTDRNRAEAAWPLCDAADEPSRDRSGHPDDPAPREDRSGRLAPPLQDRPLLARQRRVDRSGREQERFLTAIGA